MRNISELKYKTTAPGWWVRFKIGKVIQMPFYDSRYGGHNKALAIAKRFRDAVERELEPERYRRIPRTGQITTRNKSGIVGVQRIDRKHKRGKWNCRTLSWEAHWPTIDGKRGYAKFPIRTHGENEAKRLAINARLQGIHELNAHVFSTFHPPKDNLKLWRYMDFTKFVAMLENNGLFFTRATQMDDAFEGGYSRGNDELRDLVYKAMGPFQVDRHSIEKRRSNVALNCWHANEHESAAMWKLYSSANESICIQTTFGALRRCLPLGVEIGRVQYIDYETEWVPERHPMLPFLYKRKSFEHEQEFRAIRDLEDKGSTGNFTNKPSDGGLWVDCSPTDLIQAIYVAPNVKRWFRELVVQLVQRYGLNMPVKESSLALKPMY